MKVEVKNLKYYESLSEETCAFDCSIHVDDKPRLHASNRGTGGSNEYMWHKLSKDTEGSPYSLVEKIDAFFAKKFEPYNFDGRSLDYDLEQFISMNIDLKLLKQQFNNIMNKLAIIEGGEIFTFKLKASDISEAHISQIKSKYKNAEILNTMDRDVAFQKFVELSGMKTPKKRETFVADLKI